MNHDTLTTHPFLIEILIDVREIAAEAARALTDEHGSISPVGLMYTQLQLAAQAIVREMIDSTARNMAGTEFKVWWVGEMEKLAAMTGHSLPDGYHQLMAEMSARAEAWLSQRTAEIAEALFVKALETHQEMVAERQADDGTLVEAPPPGPSGPEWVRDVLEEGGKP